MKNEIVTTVGRGIVMDQKVISYIDPQDVEQLKKILEQQQWVKNPQPQPN